MSSAGILQHAHEPPRVSGILIKNASCCQHLLHSIDLQPGWRPNKPTGPFRAGMVVELQRGARLTGVQNRSDWYKIYFISRPVPRNDVPGTKTWNANEPVAMSSLMTLQGRCPSGPLPLRAIRGPLKPTLSHTTPLKPPSCSCSACSKSLSAGAWFALSSRAKYRACCL